MAESLAWRRVGGDPADDQVRLVFDTCTAADRPLVDSAHTGEAD